MRKLHTNIIFIVLAALCAGIFIMAIIGNNSYIFAAGFVCTITTALVFIAHNWFSEIPIVVSDKKPDVSNEMIEVYDALNKAKNFYLETEVVSSALLEMKRDPSISITEAMNRSLKEWDI